MPEGVPAAAGRARRQNRMRVVRMGQPDNANIPIREGFKEEVAFLKKSSAKDFL